MFGWKECATQLSNDTLLIYIQIGYIITLFPEFNRTRKSHLDLIIQYTVYVTTYEPWVFKISTCIVTVSLVSKHSGNSAQPDLVAYEVEMDLNF